MTTTDEHIALDRPVVEVSESGARALADAYWDEIRRLSLGAVRVRDVPGGIELVLARALPLFRFGEAEVSVDVRRVECRFPIVGGLLAKRPGGSLAIVQSGGEQPQLAVTVEDYAPRLDSGRARGLRTLAYLQLQRRAHVAVGRRYLARMAGGRR